MSARAKLAMMPVTCLMMGVAILGCVQVKAQTGHRVWTDAAPSSVGIVNKPADDLDAEAAAAMRDRLRDELNVAEPKDRNAKEGAESPSLSGRWTAYLPGGILQAEFDGRGSVRLTVDGAWADAAYEYERSRLVIRGHGQELMAGQVAFGAGGDFNLVNDAGVRMRFVRNESLRTSRQRSWSD